MGDSQQNFNVQVSRKLHGFRHGVQQTLTIPFVWTYKHTHMQTLARDILYDSRPLTHGLVHCIRIFRQTKQHRFFE